MLLNATKIGVTEKHELLRFFDGSYVDATDVSVVESASIVSCTLEKLGGGDLQIKRPSGIYTLDTSPPLSVVLTQGTSTTPQQNWIFLEDDGGGGMQLSANTTGWPSVEHSRIASVVILDAAATAADGALKVHVYSDHLVDGIGHMADLGTKLRVQAASWISGVVPTTVPTLLGSGANFHVSTTSGEVFQLHPHTMPALDSAVEGILVPNDFATPWLSTTNMNTLQDDSQGASMLGKSYNLVIWGIVSEKFGDCHLLCNLPSGVYNNSAAAIADNNKLSSYSIPTDFAGTGFLIARISVSVNGAGTSFTVEAVEDLRGLIPSTSPGGGTGGLGDVAGPASSTDEALARFDGASGKVIQNSNATLDDAGNLTVTGDIRGDLIRGGISSLGISVATSLTTQNTWYQALAFDTNDSSNGATPDHTQDHITIDEDGDYLVNFVSTWDAGTDNTYETNAFINNGTTQLGNLHSDQELRGGAADIVTHTCGSGLVALSAGDTLELWCRCTTAAGTTMTHHSASLTVLKVGN